MEFINRFSSAYKAFINPNSISFKTGRETVLDGIGNFSFLRQDVLTAKQQIIAFDKCPALGSIISKKVRAHLNGKYYFLDENGNEVNNKYSSKLKELFLKPNCLQTWNQFEAQAKMYIQIFGECIILPLYPDGQENDKTKIFAMFVIPNWCVTNFKTGKHFKQNDINNIIDHYQIGSGQDNFTTTASKIISIKDFYVSSINSIDSQSRMISLQDPISNIIAAYEARNVLIQKRGAIGILSNDTKDATTLALQNPKEMQNVQDAFQKYGLSKEQYQIVISNANLKWQAMTFPTRELMLFEEIEDSTRAIAEIYEVPQELTGFKTGASLSNGGDKREAKLGWYQDTIIPESEMFYKTFSNWFETVNYGFEIKVFYDHLYIFKKDIKIRAEALNIASMGLLKSFQSLFITKEEARKELANYIDIDPVNVLGNSYFEGVPVKDNQNGTSQN